MTDRPGHVNTGERVADHSGKIALRGTEGLIGFLLPSAIKVTSRSVGAYHSEKMLAGEVEPFNCQGEVRSFLTSEDV